MKNGVMDDADRQAKETDVRYTHEEMFSKLRGATNRQNRILTLKV